jgi:sulfur carrier protein
VKYELNGETFETPGPVSVLELLRQHELTGRRIAVAINAEVVPRSRFATAEIGDGDRVEVIHAVGGG